MPEIGPPTRPLGFEILGEVENAEDTYNTPCAVVVPLHAGSGMRIKLAEALAAGRPVITTSKGMEGMDLTHEKHVLVANGTPEMSSLGSIDSNRILSAIELGKAGRAMGLGTFGPPRKCRQMTDHLQTWVNE